MSKTRKVCVEEKRYSLSYIAMIFVVSTIGIAIFTLLLFVVLCIVLDYPLLERSISITRLLILGSSLSLILLYILREEFKVIKSKEVTIREIED